MKSEIVIFETGNIKLEVPFTPEQETVWLNRNQLAELFGRDIKTIGKHINNALKEELNDNEVVAKFATTTQHGAIEGKTQTHMTEYYNLDMIISVGYRVKSKRGVEFRRWANRVLKDYIIKGYAVNDDRINQLKKVIQVMKRAEHSLDARQVLSVIENYNVALDILDDYDHQSMKKPEGSKAIYTITYDECRKIIDEMKYGNDSDLFGNEKDDSFKSSIGAVYQTFSGEDVYPSLEEKAANLLYFVTKNHSFSDGNKRIAAAMFIYFLDRNNALFIDGDKVIEDYTLIALTIMIAESKPEEKEIMIKIIMNCLNRS
ncbi:MAG TPA: virulence protein RhuM/Fic/DOC family protein [Lachnospiraceae bacterium]|nr:virulence protein RhuM/Fic/DOC family protein [Lachnospiraceae bacterium]